jgi:hypothetical protein
MKAHHGPAAPGGGVRVRSDFSIVVAPLSSLEGGNPSPTRRTIVHRRILVMVAIFATALAVPLTAATPAQAYGNRPPSCDTARLCFYNFIQFRASDGVGKVADSNTHLAIFPHASCDDGTWDDCMSSVWNATNKCFHLHEHIRFIGGYHNLSPDDGYSDMGAQTSLNNRVSSVERGSSSSCNF